MIQFLILRGGRIANPTEREGSERLRRSHACPAIQQQGGSPIRYFGNSGSVPQKEGMAGGTTRDRQRIINPYTRRRSDCKSDRTGTAAAMPALPCRNKVGSLIRKFVICSTKRRMWLADSLISPRPCIVPGILAGKNTKNVVLDRKIDKQLGFLQKNC